MPIPFALLVGFALGAALSWVAAPELSRDEGPVALSRSFAIVAAFAGFVWLPVVAYFVVFHGDWSYLYVLPWRRVPSAVDLGFLMVAAVAVAGGFWLGAELVRKRRFKLLVTLIVAPSATVLAGLSMAARRLAVSGTFAQFHGDFGTEPIGASSLGKGVLLMGIALSCGIAWTVRWLLVVGSESP